MKKQSEPQERELKKAPGEVWSAALEKFAASMILGFDEWHDGIGYDLDALRELHGEERDKVEAVLIARKDEDWRDSEALAALNSAAATDALTASLSSPNAQVQLRAAKLLQARGQSEELEKIIVRNLRESQIYGGLTQALQLAEEHPTERVKQTLFWCALRGYADVRVHAAALLFYLYEKAETSFDWNLRPFFLRFASEDIEERQAAFRELCDRLEVDAAQLDLES